MAAQRTFEVKALTRVEGEGRLYVRLNGDAVEHVEFNIYEPPRFFESFLRGREIREVPDITARICGICPVAYQMSACHSLEKALGIQVTPEIRALRRLLYCGEWIESHALHIHLLHAPDYLGYESGIAMAADHRDVVERGLRLKKIGNEILEVLGGRAIHPINVTVGGFYRAPRVADMRRLLPELEWGLQAALDTVRFVAALEFPDFEQDYECVSLRHPDEYPMNEGHVVTSSGLDIPIEQYEQHFQERHEPQSTARTACCCRMTAVISSGRSPASICATIICRRWPGRRWTKAESTGRPGICFTASSPGPLKWSRRTRRRCGSSAPIRWNRPSAAFRLRHTPGKAATRPRRRAD
ncbi:MAG: nickel-dependent hydrogenase large subunit [Planctomycetaceae bacterium]